MAEPTLAQASATEIISGIAQLWKLAACIALPLTIFFLRKPLAKILPTLRRIKRGDTEIELAQEEKVEAVHEGEPASKEAPPEEKEKQPPEEEAEEERSTVYKVFDAILKRDNDSAEALFKEWIEKEPEKKTENEVFYYTLLCNFQKDAQAVEKLKSFAENEAYVEQAPEILRTIGEFYESTDQHAKALNFFEQSKGRSVKPEDEALALTAKSRVLASTERPENALQLLQNALRKFSDEASLALLYSRIAEIYRLMGNELGRCAALEKVVEYRPADTDALFEAAYAQSAADIPHISLHNYWLELQLKPDQSTARNNYAVQLAELGLSANSVDQYRKAQDDGNTLAAANLAYLYLDKGLTADAERILREAQSKQKYHGNVDNALTKLRTMRRSEDDKLEQINRWAATYQRFLRAYAEALLIPRDKTHRSEGSWTAENNDTILIKQERGQFQTEWGPKNSRRKIEGTQVNHSASIKLYAEKTTFFASDEKPNYGTPQKALAYLSDDGSEFEMLTYGKEDPQRIVLRRAEKPNAEQ